VNERAGFVERAQEVGFTLAQAEELRRLAEGWPESCAEAGRVAAERIAELDLELARLETMREELRQVLACLLGQADDAPPSMPASR
jgi:MerR family mercuric resistance operon transcriptional regulator